MKKILLLIIFINLQFINAQKCLMQPALSESGKKLDNLHIYIQLPGQDEYLEAIIQNLTFDSDKNPTSDTYEKYDENGEVIKRTRSSRTYYPFDEYIREKFPKTFPINELITEIFNLNTSSWLPEHEVKYTKNEKYTYDGNKKNYILTFYDADFNIGNRFKKETTTSNGFPIERTQYMWDSNTDTFSPYNKDILNNSFSGAILSERTINRITDFNTNIAETYRKEQFFEDDGNHLYQKLTSTWDGANWNSYRLKQVSYTNDLITDITYNNWDSTNSNWVEYTGVTYTYDANGNISTYHNYENDQLKYSDTFTYDSENLLTSRFHYTYDTNTGDLVETKRYVYNYTQDNLAINDTNLMDVALYPNPVKNSLNISTDKPFNYTIVSIQGSKVLQGSSQNTIDVQTLKNGLYFITLDIGNKQITKKIIVNK